MKEGNSMIKFRVLCIKDYECKGVVLWRKGCMYTLNSCDESNKAYRISLNDGERLCPYNKFSEHFEKIPTNVRLMFHADFSTDGDFHFDETRLKGLEPSPLYDGAAVNYKYDKDWEFIEFDLVAEGKSEACRYALRDLLEEMIASFRTYPGKYYLIKDVYDLLEGFHRVIWNNNEVRMEDGMSGNYDGTFISLSITEIPDEEDAGEYANAIEPDPTTNWIEIVVDGEEKLKCPNCNEIHPDVPYVRGFKHCPSCGEVLK